MNLTLQNKGENPEQYQVSTKEDAYDLFHHWYDKKKKGESVFVSFQNWRGLPKEYLGDEQTSFLVSHDADDTDVFVDELIRAVDIDSLDLVVFEFENYETAFTYCKYLKEGF